MMRADEIYQEVKKRMAELGLKSKEEYLKLVDDVINEWIEGGLMDSEEDTTSLRDELLRRWQE